MQKPLAKIALLRELFEVWNPLGMDGLFVFFRGYIDESYNQHVFTLSCLLSTGKIWSEFARSWKFTIDSWNKKFKRQGRQTFARYHATDCSNFKREFANWTKDEQREFFADILKIFRRHQVDTVALSVNLDDFDKYFPEARKEAKPDFETFLYGMTTKFLIERIADRHCVKNPANKIALVHDGCGYSGVMLDAFNHAKHDLNFAYGDCFTTFAASDWKHCIPLQPADLVAYENFKDAMRKINPRDRRVSFEMLIDLDAFSGRAQSMDKEAILRLRKEMIATAARMGIAVPNA